MKAANFYFKIYKKCLENIGIFQVQIKTSSYFEIIFYRNLPIFKF